MKFFKRFLIIVCAVTVSLLVVPGASADDWNHKTIVTFSGPVEVPGVGAQVLPAGTYVFKLVDSLSDRHIVQIFNKEETHVFTTILAIPNLRMHPTDKTVITFKERAQGEPEAIRTWFYPGHDSGEEFVYPKAKALELAKISNEPVLYIPTEVASVEDLKTVPIEAVKPTGEAVPVAEVIQAPPVEVAKLEAPATLPKTGSDLPLLACMGLLSLGAAIVAKKYAA
jgi:hypothetical protein